MSTWGWIDVCVAFMFVFLQRSALFPLNRCNRCTSASCLCMGKARIMRLGWTITRLLRRRRSFLITGGKITSKLLLFAFSVQACRCDMLEQTIIMTAYEVFAYWSISIFVFCFSFFSTSLLFSQQAVFHSPSPSLTAIVQAWSVGHCSMPFSRQADRDRSEYYWSQVLDPAVGNVTHKLIFCEITSYLSHFNLLIWSFSVFSCLWTMSKC